MASSKSHRVRSFDISKLVVHEIPRQLASAHVAPRLSEIESDLPEDVSHLLAERTVDALGLRGFAATVDRKSRSPVPAGATNFLAGQEEFVPVSQRFARHLASVQAGNASAGLLVVAAGQSETKGAMAIIKLERLEGLRVEFEQRDGLQTFDVSHIRNLMLTEKTRFFKVCMFVQPEQGKQWIRVADPQKGKGGIADFFLTSFLGCKYVEEPKVLTERALTAAESFINRQIKDPERRATATMALLSELQSSKSSFEVETFAENHLKGKDRQAFVVAMEEAGVPTTSFPVDTVTIKSRIRRVLIAFKNGCEVLATREALKNKSVKVNKTDGGKDSVEVVDTITKTVGK